jgi:hypothetical protein
MAKKKKNSWGDIRFTQEQNFTPTTASMPTAMEMEGMADCDIYDDDDFYGIEGLDDCNTCDEDKIEKLQEKRARKWLQLYKKFMDAREKNDKAALEKTKEALRKHDEQDRVFKKKAEESCSFWM